MSGEHCLPHRCNLSKYEKLAEIRIKTLQLQTTQRRICKLYDGCILSIMTVSNHLCRQDSLYIHIYNYTYICLSSFLICVCVHICVYITDQTWPLQIGPIVWYFSNNKSLYRVQLWIMEDLWTLQNLRCSINSKFTSKTVKISNFHFH